MSAYLPMFHTSSATASVFVPQNVGVRVRVCVCVCVCVSVCLCVCVRERERLQKSMVNRFLAIYVLAGFLVDWAVFRGFGWQLPIRSGDTVWRCTRKCPQFEKCIHCDFWPKVLASS